MEAAEMSSTPLQMVGTECQLCGCSDGEVVLVGRDREHDLPGEFSIVRCDRCSHHRLDPRPADSQLARLYPNDYRPFAGGGEGSPVSWAGRLRHRIVDLLHFGPTRLKGAGRLLEVGCGSGALLERFASLGWSVTGIEPSRAASEAARGRGLDVLTGTDQLTDSLEPATFDLVHAFMVIEHTPDPVESLRRLRRVATDDGRLRVSVPNFAHRSRVRFGDCWYALQLPRHYQHFSPDSIRRAMDAAGWSVDRVWYQPTNDDLWRSIDIQIQSGAEVDRLAALLPLSKAIDLTTLPARLLTAQLLGSSRMTITAHPATRGSAS